MSETPRSLTAHYAGDPEEPILARILGALAASGVAVDPLDPEALAPVEEFHIGGRKATAATLAKLALTPQTRLLDIGCGIGGAARHAARHAGCAVTGIDLTEDYIAAARELSRRCGLDARLRFEVGDATALPFPDHSFEAAITLHAAMNIADRDALYAEAARALVPGGRLCLYDVMRVGPGETPFPVPWSSAPEHSFLLSPEETVAALDRAGFEIETIEDWRDVALSYVAPPAKTAAAAEKPALGKRLVMGPNAALKAANLRQAVTEGVVSPVAIVARTRAARAGAP